MLSSRRWQDRRLCPMPLQHTLICDEHPPHPYCKEPHSRYSNIPSNSSSSSSSSNHNSINNIKLTLARWLMQAGFNESDLLGHSLELCNDNNKYHQISEPESLAKVCQLVV
ncbi:hypothetical protein H4S06_003575 [Coemansia sp. BCRC 34490]|nr:hypothetical protein H4S06_003575 [Coemansia sp. BCRC 34490]